MIMIMITITITIDLGNTKYVLYDYIFCIVIL